MDAYINPGNAKKADRAFQLDIPPLAVSMTIFEFQCAVPVILFKIQIRLYLTNKYYAASLLKITGVCPDLQDGYYEKISISRIPLFILPTLIA